MQESRFLALPPEQRSVEALIGRLNFRICFDLFIAMQPDEMSMTKIEGYADAQAKDKCSLLHYIRSCRSVNMAKFMVQAMEDCKDENVTLTKFERQMRRNFKDQGKMDKLKLFERRDQEQDL